MKNLRKFNESASSNRSSLKLMKVFDVQFSSPKMPDNVKRIFFDYFDCGNDVWVDYTIGESEELFDTWLLENTDVSVGESILLKHWW